MKKIIAWFLAFLLTGSLILFGVCLVGRQVIAPALGEEGAPVSESLIREEKDLARERIAALSELYGFDPEPVAALVNEDVLKDLNSQASLWWSSVLRDGKAGKDLRWDTTELEKVLAADPAAQENPDEAEYYVSSVAEEIHKSIVNMVLPMRQLVISLGLEKAGKRVDIVNIVEFFVGMPWAALALAALIAGLIALTDGRTIRRVLGYIGSAMGAAALVLAVIAVLYLCAGILPMIKEASTGLTLQYQSTVTSSLLLTAGIVVVLAAGCVACLLKSREKKA
ncbi:MAG: hypothetical protein IKZ98_04345 [Clostridia bacterium]|nr:hypothetical protein [Clostridia bacterium]